MFHCEALLNLKRTPSVKIIWTLVDYKTVIWINPLVLLASFPVNNSVLKQRAIQSIFAPTACKRPALNFIVTVRRDYFARPEHSRPIHARELGFPDQPLTGRAGSKKKIEERTSSPHLLRMSPLFLLLSCASAFSFSCLFFLHPFLSLPHFSHSVSLPLWVFLIWQHPKPAYMPADVSYTYFYWLH